MGLLRNLAHTIFGFLLLTALWVTALSFLSMRPSSTAVITDLGVDALNPWLVTKSLGVSAAGYSKLELAATASPDKALSLTFIKPVVKGSEIKGLSYQQGMRVIYGHVANAYYDGGPAATFSLPAPVASAVQTFALFPEQYDAAVKSTQLPSWLQPFMLFTGLSPETLTATGHTRIEALLPKFWIAALLFAGIIFLLNLLGRRNPVESLGLAALHGSWPTVAVFGVLWLMGRLYPANVQPAAAAFGVVAGAFMPVYGVAAAVGLGAFLAAKGSGWLMHAFGGSGGKAKARQPEPAAVYSGYSARSDNTPAYTPGGAPGAQHYAPPQPSAPTYQPGGAQDAGWNPPARQSWEQPAQPSWDATSPRNPGQPTWNQPRPWDAPDPNAQGHDAAGGDYPPTLRDDPTAPRW